MSMEMWRPWRTGAPWRELEARMDRLFNEVFGQTGMTAPTEAPWLPSVEMFERDDALVVRADVPGMKREDITVEVTDHTLMITGERKADKEIKEEHYYRCERAYGAFRRMLTLPAEVDTSKIAATYNEGVLEITLPKTTRAEAKKIDIH